MIRKIGFALAMVATLAVGCSIDGAEPKQQTQSASIALEGKEAPPFSTAEANVLIFGNGSAVGAMNTLKSHLEDLGHSATLQFAELPNDLTPFNTVWFVANGMTLSPSVRARLLDFLADGGGVHLSGENPNFDSFNDSLSAFVHEAVIDSDGITIGRQGAVSGYRSLYYPINPSAISDVTALPNATERLELSGAGGIGGVAPLSENALAFGGFSANKVVGAAWPAEQLVGGAGKLSIVMDVNWISKLAESDNDNGKLIENLQEFLTGTVDVNQPPVAVAVLPPGQLLDCDDGSGEARESIPVRINGEGSSDPEGEPISFNWFSRGSFIGSGPEIQVSLPVGTHTITLVVDDGEQEDFAEVTFEIICNIDCTPGDSLFTRCHPGCPCAHSEGDCDTDADCEPGLTCLHDAGFAFGYEDDEVDVCSSQCPVLGVGAWNYCSPECPCDAGEGDCESDEDCGPGLRCISDIGPAFGFQREVDVCEPG